jgi:hyperosmotically inducible periplasmic protein
MTYLSSLKKFVAMAALVASVAACSVVTNQESAGAYVDDTAITTKVKAAIFNEPSLKSMQISVETMKDEVQLSGFVDSQRSRTVAGDLARNVSGVRAVRNDLIVR